MRLGQRAGVDPLLLGFGLVLAWSVCMPWASSRLASGMGPNNLGAVVHALALLALAAFCNLRRVNLYSKGLAALAGTLATAAPILSVASSLALSGAAGTYGRALAAVLNGVSLALMYLLWNEQIARRPLYVSWPSYAASFAVAPLAYFVLTSLPAAAAAAIALCMPAASCAMLARSARAEEGAEQAAEAVSRAWRFPWRPALLMAAFSFSHYMLMHLSGGTSAFGQLGGLVAAGAVLLAATAFFDRLDLGVLYRTAVPLMMCALLCLPFAASGTGGGGALAAASSALSYSGFTVFSLFTAFVLSAICFRYGVHAAWLFGVVEGCDVLAHAAGSAAGSGLLAWSSAAGGAAALSAPLDAAAAAIVVLAMALMSDKGFSTTWGIRPARRAGAARGGTEGGAGNLEPTGDDEDGEPRQKSDGVIGAPASDAFSPGGAARLGTSGASVESLLDRCARVARHFGLTRREEEILSLIAQGRSAPELEAELYISHNTAKGHIRHLYAKLGVHSRDEAVAIVAGWR